MNPASPTEFMNNSLHIHIHQKFREGITLLFTLRAAEKMGDLELKMLQFQRNKRVRFGSYTVETSL